MNVPWAPDDALSGAAYSAAELSRDGTELFVLDQRLLLEQEAYRSYRSAQATAECIRDMVVRGAPAIGITAAYGMALAAHAERRAGAAAFREAMARAAESLVAARPTAVNLAWAVRRCQELVAAHAERPGAERHRELCELGRSIHRDDVAACRAIGSAGAERIADGSTVLTHCNAGALATGGYGTALGVIRAVRDAGKAIRVIATETRPYLQGARLTAWELTRDDFEVTLITDGMVGHCMRAGMIDAVVVGADRIAANGDVANKIGTYAVGCLASHHDIPFYVAAPWSTVDLATPTGADIRIEERAREEMTRVGGRLFVPERARVYHPAFDVTPARLIRAIFTERGAFAPDALGG
jgi:methylthioribose-1-phosphate isomerase